MSKDAFEGWELIKRGKKVAQFRHKKTGAVASLAIPSTPKYAERAFARALELHEKVTAKMPRMPLKIRIALAWRAFRDSWKRWMSNPAPSPAAIGTKDAKGMRPIPIELGFYLHPDGSVTQRRRDSKPDEIVTDEHMIGAVHREYKILVDMATKARYRGGNPAKRKAKRAARA